MSNLNKFTTPILFLVFKRPDTTRRVFKEIRCVRPTRLYVAGDGPRPDKSDEAEKVKQTRQLVLDHIDWDCDVKTRFRETNLGCRDAITDALDWFFEHEEMGIILEDDCVPSQSFFPFCQELLERYRDDERIMVISGDNYQDGIQRGNYSYYFSQLSHVWGWASWRRAWRLNQIAIDHFEEITADPVNLHFTHNSWVNKIQLTHFIKTYHRQIDSWGYLWSFANLVNHGLTILPNVNLVQNIGFGADATHTKALDNKGDVIAQNITFPLKHPPYVIYNWAADDYTYNRKYKTKTMWRRILNKILRLFRTVVYK